MSTIPANQIVQVIPGVLNAGGNALQLIGLVLTRNSRVPIGQVLSFPNASSVGTYFGLSSKEYAIAQVYFLGFTNCTALPAALLFVQYNQNDVSAYVRGANAGLTIPQLQALNQAISVVMDGYTYSATVNLSSATSYTSAASLIQTGLNTSLPAGASLTGSIAATTFSITASIAGLLMTVTAVASGVIVPGAVISGTGIASGTQVGTQISGTPGGIGVYAVSVAQAAPVPSETISGTYGTLTVTAVGSGTLSVGQTVTGGTTLANTQITALGTGIGGTGTYFVNLTQTVTSGALTSTGTKLAVTYDSISGAFVITSGSVGAPSTAAFPTGALATSLFLTQVTGAVLSQGASATTPSSFMTGVIAQTTNWATFMTAFDPDGGSGNTVKLQFSAWVNTTLDEFAYVCWDNDIMPTESTNASTSMGQILKSLNSSGTILVYEPTDLNHAAFICGIAASINFQATNGRITFAFREQTGLVASVTDAVTAANLLANGYNFYGAYATANQSFVWLYNGSVSGPYEWADAYVDQIWLNSALQLALMELLQNTPSIPYNNAGYALIAAAMQDPINAALLFGAIRPNVPLSSAQIAEINNAAGNPNVANIVATQGYYVQILPASPQVRQARGTPPINFWYTDGGAVQKITLASIDVQ